jgi:hypothetical protein
LKPQATIEAQIEAAWCELDDNGGTHRYYFADGKLRRGPWIRGEKVTIVGTFTRAISLADFRDEVYSVYATLREAKNGGR